MDYEKAYKEALERAKNLHEDAIDMGENIRAKQCEIIFPELAESEDERIRKALIRYHQSTIDVDGIEGKKIIAWLEKQGETSPILSNSLNIGKSEISGNEGKISPKWSKEDEEEFKIAIETLHEAGQHSSAMWLKSIKQRIAQ